MQLTLMLMLLLRKERRQNGRGHTLYGREYLTRIAEHTRRRLNLNGIILIIHILILLLIGIGICLLLLLLCLRGPVRLYVGLDGYGLHGRHTLDLSVEYGATADTRAVKDDAVRVLAQVNGSYCAQEHAGGLLATYVGVDAVADAQRERYLLGQIFEVEEVSVTLVYLALLHETHLLTLLFEHGALLLEKCVRTPFFVRL